MQVKDCGESECCSVTERIEVVTSPHTKVGRLPHSGYNLYKKLLELSKGGKQMNEIKSCAPTDLWTTWEQIQWNKCEHEVRKLQARIVKAQMSGRHNKVKALQWMLTHSFYGKALAVKRVTSNGGKKTAGVDHVLWNTPNQKMDAIASLKRRGYHPQPLRRVNIKKSNGKCTAPQKLDTFGVFFMKYNYEIRLKAVKLVLEGGLSVREAGCHLGCGRSQVHLWVTLFERHGLTGLKLRHGSYSAEFKLSVLKHMHQNHLSLLETAVHFGIPGPFVIRQWERLYQNQGAEGLRRKPQRRRPAMSKSKTKKVKLKTTPHEELLKELEYLRAENAYLKKLQALVEERIVRESGKEPKPSKD